MSYKPYPAYKDSGVEWLGEIPENWEIRHLSDASSQLPYSFVDGPFGSNLKNEEYTDDGIPLIQLNNIGIGYHSVSNLNYISYTKAEELLRHNCVPGDIVIAKMADPVGRACIVCDKYKKYVIVADCVKLASAAELVEKKYIVYSLNSDIFKSIMEVLSTGTTRLRINLSELKKIPLVFPPLSTQKAIAAFLDARTARIDGLVQDYEDLVALLREKRQALVSHAVTRGLSELVSPDDPEFGEWARPVTFKDSGVEWLGEIPEGWEVTRVKYIVMLAEGIQMGPFGGTLKDVVLYEPNTYIVYGQANTISGEFNQAYRWLSPESFASLSSYEICPGDLVITRKGSLGNSRVVPNGIERGIADSDTIRVRINPSLISAEYLQLYLHESHSAKRQTEEQSRGAILPGINTETVGDMIIPLPSRSQQNAILKYSRSVTAKLDDLVAEAEGAIELLKERRSALITAAVTGKINVEGAEAAQP